MCVKQKLPPKQPAKITAKVAETMAWKDGKRVGLGSKDYTEQHPLDPAGSARRLTRLYSTPDSAHPNLDSATAASWASAWPLPTSRS